jgi:hypothetical protein
MVSLAEPFLCTITSRKAILAFASRSSCPFGAALIRLSCRCDPHKNTRAAGCPSRSACLENIPARSITDTRSCVRQPQILFCADELVRVRSAVCCLESYPLTAKQPSDAPFSNARPAPTNSTRVRFGAEVSLAPQPDTTDALIPSYRQSTSQPPSSSGFVQ